MRFIFDIEYPHVPGQFDGSYRDCAKLNDYVPLEIEYSKIIC